MVQKISILLCIIFITNVIAEELEKPYQLRNGLIDGIDIKSYIKRNVLIDGYYAYLQLYDVYLFNEKDNEIFIEPVEDNNKDLAFQYIDENNGIVCPINSELSKMNSILSQLCNSYYRHPSMKSIVLGTTDCSICYKLFQK